jgi:hypothetical protein
MRYWMSGKPKMAWTNVGFIFLLLAVSAGNALAQPSMVFVPYEAAGYKILMTKGTSVPVNFQSPTFNDASWATAVAAVGKLNPPCPLNTSAHVHTEWTQSKDVLLRKHITLPAGARNVQVSLALDNQAQVWLNGTDISGGIRTHQDCASPGDFVFNVPDNLLIVGDNVLAVRGFWGNGNANSYLDVQVSGNISSTITATAGANGTIAPLGVTNVIYGGSQSYTITPNLGYHVADVLVDGVSVGAMTSYTFTNVMSNRTISATFAINVYTITASAGANGSIAPPGSTNVNYGGGQNYTITPGTGYHVADVLVDGASVGPVFDYRRCWLQRFYLTDRICNS